MHLALSVLIALVVLADDTNVAPKFTSEAEKASLAREAQIEAELQTLSDHPWAGQYYWGDGLGANVSLTLAPENGFTFEWRGCLGVYDRNYGSVTEQDGHIRLTCTYENVRDGFQGVQDDLLAIPWGDRVYLIPASDIAGFCNQINEGNEPRDTVHGEYFLRVGDETKPVSGMPDIPEAYREYLLKDPVEARIAKLGNIATATGEANTVFRYLTVELDAGLEAGLRDGMELHGKVDGVFIETARITKANKTNSEAVITLIEDDPKPRVGCVFSTRPN